MRKPQHRHRKQRRGITIMELVAACAILVILVLSTALVVSRVMKQRISLGRSVVATETLANVLERIDARPFGQLTPDSLRDIELPEHVQQALPRAELQLTSEYSDHPQAPRSRRIYCRIQWQNNEEEPTSTVGATLWRYEFADEVGP